MTGEMGSDQIILKSELARQRAIDLINAVLISETKPYVVIIAPYEAPRSRSQLALLWVRHHALADAVAQHTGYTAEDIHEFFKEKFLPGTLVEIRGDIIKRCSTRRLTVRQMAEFMEKIEAWAATELNLRLPSPEDRYAA